MSFERFIALRIIRSKMDEGNGSSTRPIIRIAVLAIALGVAVMIISMSIVTGFQNEIRNKVIGFGAHIQITAYSTDNALETNPVSRNQPFYPSLDTVKGVRHIQVYANKPGIIRTEEEIQGVVLKGVDRDFDWSFFRKNMKEGAPIHLPDSGKSDEIIISSYLAKKLRLHVDDKVVTYFIQQPPRMRIFSICGIYKTGMEQFDRSCVLADIRHIQKLNAWGPEQVSGFEVLIDRWENLGQMDEFIYNYIGQDLNSTPITERYRDIFGWLELQDWNVVIIITLMVLVGGINMVSALLIIILERTSMIGLLKAMGAINWSIRKIFIYNAAYLIGVGILWGNFIGLSICVIQQQTGLITLPQESYYISTVPINIDVPYILLLNAGVLLACTAMLILPSWVITRISPVKAIRFN
ncbi:MAG: ABC transporter permease [Flavobacteriales bacterium]